jgi:hypothetical protein
VKRKPFLGGRHASSRSECPSDQVDGASVRCGRVFSADLGGVVSFSLRGPRTGGYGKVPASVGHHLTSFATWGTWLLLPKLASGTWTVVTGGFDSDWYQELLDVVLPACGLCRSTLPALPTRCHRITAARFVHKRKSCTCASAMQEIEPSARREGLVTSKQTSFPTLSNH